MKMQRSRLSDLPMTAQFEVETVGREVVESAAQALEHQEERGLTASFFHHINNTIYQNQGNCDYFTIIFRPFWI